MDDSPAPLAGVEPDEGLRSTPDVHLPTPAASSGSDGEAHVTGRLTTAFGTWRGRLIDLTKRNQALNYRPRKVATLAIVDEKPAEIYRLLVGEQQPLTFVATLPSKKGKADDETAAAPGAPRPLGNGATPTASRVAAIGGTPGSDEEDDTSASDLLTLQPFAPYEREDLADHHTDTVLQCRATPEGLDTSLRRLAELQRTSLEEQGVNTLYLALGFLHYKEAPQAETFLRAPLVLVPVILERQSARAGYHLVLGDDEPVVNPSLMEYLRRVHHITTMPTLPEPADDPASCDLRPFFGTWSKDIADPHGWKVTEEIVLATFAFQKLVIFKDLEENEEQFRKHPLVRRVVLKEGEPAHDLPPEIRDLQLDQDYPPEATHQVLDADSSQLRAIAAVAKGHDIVIHGPPGTGKSQTITNLIADALGTGKRVLFVSEKMAALEVVHRRLTEATLGEFCLELHSTKVNKNEVIEGLKLALHAHGNPAPGAAGTAEALAKTRKHLNTYASELHQPRTSLGCTAYCALGEYAATFTAPRFPYPADPTAMTPEVRSDLLDRLHQAETLGSEVAPVAENGWRDARLDQYSQDIADRIGTALEEARRLAGALLSEASELASTFGVPEPETLARANALTRVADHLAAATGMPAAVLRDSRWATRPPEVADLLALGQQYAALEHRLTSRYRREALETLDPDEIRYVEHKLSGAFAFLAVLDGRYRAIRRRWQVMRLAADELSMLDQAADLKKVAKWQRDKQALATHAEAGAWFGAAWRGPASDWKDLDARVAWVEQFHRMVAAEGPFEEKAYRLAEEGGRTHPLPQQVRGTVAELERALQRLRQFLGWPEGYLADRPVAAILARLDELRRDLKRGPAWVNFVRAMKALAGTPAEEIGEAAFAGRIPVSELQRAFRRSLYAAWLERVIPSAPSLADFSTAWHEEIRRTFHELDTRLLSATQARLVTRLREMGASRYASSPSAQRTFLQKEFAKQKRHRPLRVTLREAGEAVLALKPCFLMSPMSVSQFLAPDMVFDLVVFDEASQLPTEDAIAAICRGKQLVVVGDPKQLPPTNFFTVQIGATNPAVDENGDPVLEETESVLEEFQAAGLHQAHLEWHYRSAHEALIQFSNERFYDNRLVVFPAAVAEGPEFGLRFEYIPEGRYEGAGVNPIEAQRVAAAVIKHLRTRPHETLGVGTFNQRQQLAILDELERYRREDPSLEPFFDRAAHEPFFVKNLENIQGDERDVIFLSITYARQADGRLRYNFGPLNKQEGWRRLNVLVSRARRRMQIFSSLKATDINPTAAASQGPALLRDFLQFAETGRMQVTSRSSAAAAESLFELEVGEVLQSMGYLVDRQVGVGSYRLDLAVRVPERPGRYLAGVECDGATYHAAPCARDRDRLRQQVLERRGWTILRVWSTDWFKDRTGTLERLQRALEELRARLPEEDAKAAQAAPPAPEAPVLIEVPDTAPVNIGPRPYVRPELPNYTMAARMQPVRESLADAPTGMVARHVGHIVDQEGPIHADELVSRLLYFWNHARRGSRLVAAAEGGIKAAIELNLITRRGDFLYPATDRRIRPRSRAGMSIGAEWVASEELMAAARVALGVADHLQEDELVTEIREMLGLKRTLEETARIRDAIQCLIQQGTVIYGVAGLRLKPAAVDTT